METTIEQQVALDEALIPSTKKAFLVTADVPTIYIQEFWATAYVHQHSISFKMDSKKNIVNLEAFREMLHISPRVPGQSFNEIPFKEEILDFLRFLGHSAQIKTLTDVNIKKLFQPWRSFAAVINKCLTGKSSGFDSLEEILDFLRFLGHSAQIKTLTDVNIKKLFQPWRSFAAVINKCLTGKSSGFDSLDFVYQAKHKNQKKSNEMDDILFSTIKVVSRHQNTQQYGVILPIELTTKDIRTTKAYKEYYACATGEAAPKPKASARRKRGGFDSSTTPPTAVASPRPITTVAAAPRLTADAKGKQPARATSPYDPSEVERTEAEQLKIVL
nr:hypothetical protein [Tanacetum cinerariifolium]